MCKRSVKIYEDPNYFRRGYDNYSGGGYNLRYDGKPAVYNRLHCVFICCGNLRAFAQCRENCACTYVVLMVFAIDSSTGARLQQAFDGTHRAYIKLTFTLALSVIYFIYSAAVTLKNHKTFELSHIAFLCGMPIPIAFAFSSLGVVINHEHGLYYLFMLLNFSSVCDAGAYFVGSTLGRHKLCPNISPHKTVEGAIGGIVSSVIVTYILGFSFSFEKNLANAVLLTVPFCILGMIGDLFASAIKRAAGIKDYGNLIPGHGGILDRFDSIIMTAPLLYLFIALGVI